ncbi:MAG: hypothetical protein PVJ76_11810 [Gemmatimonadota bacterium]|jgi:hypothetical protein
MNEMDDRLDLQSLDPGSEDPGFWLRFHGSVMGRARDELTRRRMTQELSIPEVVFQWRKPLVPLALLAATLAGIFVLGQEEPRAVISPVALEDALLDGVEGDPIPTILARTAEFDETAFLASGGGFRP